MICGYLNCSVVYLGLKGKIPVIELTGTSEQDSQTRMFLGSLFQITGIENTVNW